MRLRRDHAHEARSHCPRLNPPDGETLVMSVRLQNGGTAFSTDAYVGAVLPNGETVFFLTGLDPPVGVTATRSGDARSFPPVLASLLISAGFLFEDNRFVAFPFSGTEAPGQYTAFAALARLRPSPTGVVDNP